MRRTTLVASPWVQAVTVSCIALAVHSGGNIPRALALPPSASTVVLSFGWNASGQTGQGTTIGSTLIATPIDSSNLPSSKVTQVAAGGQFSLVLTEQGEVFAFGLNLTGRTGIGTEDGFAVTATPIDTTNLGGRAITQVAAGGSHSLILADDGTVFSFGYNVAGRTGLGIGGFSSTLVATEIVDTNLLDKTIKQVSAGGGHSLILADDGTVFSFGSNGNGITGLGTTTGNTTIATPIDTTNLAGRTITQVAAGNGHSLILADDGTVYSFGYNGRGATGLGTTIGATLVATPIDTTNLEGRTVKGISAGGEYSLILADDGTVFSFGRNEHGQTGLGTDEGHTVVPTPVDTINLSGKNITQVSGTSRSSLLLADDGSVFAFGWNFLGKTGVGSDVGDTLIATPIDMTHLTGRRVIGISAGGDHSLLLAVPEPAGGMLYMLAGLPLVLGRWRRGLGRQGLGSRNCEEWEDD